MKNTGKNTKAINDKNEFVRKNSEPAVSKDDLAEILNANYCAKDLRDLFTESIKEIYLAEKKLTEELPKIIENTTSEYLQTMIKEHLEITKNQLARLEGRFEIMEEEVSDVKSDAIENLIREGKRVINETEEGPVRDAGIIASLQKIKHYEIAAYGTLAAFAKTLGEDNLNVLLKQSLEEEKEADVQLTKAAFNATNFNAARDEIKAKNNIRGIAKTV
ncbi:ferritin-like domain-containing protein [Flavobacterium sp. MMLR14_040]|uniref:ferritin-like domain-containing protein n=1 Tax=Flavobacterium sp. MMLR14_040 TaxID=3093843 RepID=UPI00298FC016|nr:ferritin-like domain-containing protein [Flavobacterium sp. MMLR14_040]MDW8848542.1 ferritin-like domain-containing protein [Flavobacterium sp. MMLR14_040]